MKDFPVRMSKKKEKLCQQFYLALSEKVRAVKSERKRN